MNTAVFLRARLGEMLKRLKDEGKLDAGMGGDRKSQSQPATVKLTDLGLTKSDSSRDHKRGAKLYGDNLRTDYTHESE